MDKPFNWIRLLVWSGLGLFVLLCIPALFIAGPARYYSAKFGDAPHSQRPTAVPAALVPETQTEPHTCGFHALSSVYRAYGVDPNRADLRFRLGTDVPLVNVDPSTAGTVHPDMLRVLKQDRFVPTVIHPGSDDAAARITGHLDSGQVAIALVTATGLHWVAFEGVPERSGVMLICDSLTPEKSEAAVDEFLRDRAHSVVLIRAR
jgi:hypothetical protein